MLAPFSEENDVMLTPFSEENDFIPAPFSEDTSFLDTITSSTVTSSSVKRKESDMRKERDCKKEHCPSPCTKRYHEQLRFLKHYTWKRRNHPFYDFTWSPKGSQLSAIIRVTSPSILVQVLERVWDGTREQFTLVYDRKEGTSCVLNLWMKEKLVITKAEYYVGTLPEYLASIGETEAARELFKKQKRGGIEPGRAHLLTEEDNFPYLSQVIRRSEVTVRGVLKLMDTGSCPPECRLYAEEMIVVWKTQITSLPYYSKLRLANVMLGVNFSNGPTFALDFLRDILHPRSQTLLIG
jgi:hypothetical protein